MSDTLDSDPDLMPLLDWCKVNKVSRSVAYKLARQGSLELTKIGTRTYLTKESRAAFLKWLPRKELIEPKRGR